MPIFYHAQAWLEYGKEYAVHKPLWRNCALATLGPQPDNGDKARDFSGNRNHPVLNGATHLPTWSNQSYRGQAFRGLTLDGTDDWVNLGTGTSLGVSQLAGANSVAFWVYSPNATGICYHLACWDLVSGVNQRTLIVFSDTSGLINSAWSHDGIADGSYVTGTTNTTGAWTHVCVTYNGTRTLYVNGRSEGTPVTSAIYTGTTTSRVSLGCVAGRAGDTPFGFSDCSLTGLHVFKRCITPSEISILALHPLAAYEVRLPKYFFGASTAVTLTVAGSAVDVTSDSPTLTQHGALTVASSNVVTSSQAPSLTQHNVLSVGNAVCSVTAGSVSLTQHHTLSVDGSALATASGAPNLTQHSVLTVGGAACSVTSQSPALTQHAALTVQDCSVALNSQSPVLAQHSVLAVGDSQCAATSQGVALTQHNALACGNATCAVASENVVLTAHAPAVVTLTVQGSTCVISSTSPVLTQHGALIVAASQCLVSSGNVTLAYHAAGAALILEHQTLLLAI